MKPFNVVHFGSAADDVNLFLANPEPYTLKRKYCTASFTVHPTMKQGGGAERGREGGREEESEGERGREGGNEGARDAARVKEKHGVK